MPQHKKTIFLKRSINTIAGDDPERALAMEQLFCTGSSRPSRGGRGRRSGVARPASFFEDASLVAAMTAAQLRGGADFVHITEILGPRSGRVSICTSKLATFKIATGEFRLCTREEVDRFTTEEQAQQRRHEKDIA